MQAAPFVSLVNLLHLYAGSAFRSLYPHFPEHHVTVTLRLSSLKAKRTGLPITDLA